ncbi:hypothetical protein P8452_08580 [Trifolium repens]|nr:hypothetical protein P8452_08580 [Trifolium repens]
MIPIPIRFALVIQVVLLPLVWVLVGIRSTSPFLGTTKVLDSDPNPEMFYILEVLELFHEIKENLKEADKNGMLKMKIQDLEIVEELESKERTNMELLNMKI